MADLIRQQRGGRMTGRLGLIQLALLLICVGGNTLANLVLKSGAAQSPTPWLLGLLSWRSFLGLAIFGAAGLVYAVALRNVTLGLAQSVLVLQYVAILFCSWLFFSEAFTFKQFVGCAFIILGMFLMIQRA